MFKAAKSELPTIILANEKVDSLRSLPELIINFFQVIAQIIKTPFPKDYLEKMFIIFSNKANWFEAILE